MMLYIRAVTINILFLWSIGEENFWVDDGCKGTGTSHDGSFHDQSYQAGVRCCSNDGSTCTTPEDFSCKDDEMLSYGEAVSKCSDNGRLCSKDELLSGICCGTGGGCDSYEVWTSTSESGNGKY